MDDYLKGLELLRTRSKRAVIPIMGKALSVLSGTVTEEEIKTLRRRLEKAESNQKISAHPSNQPASQ